MNWIPRTFYFFFFWVIEPNILTILCAARKISPCWRCSGRLANVVNEDRDFRIVITLFPLLVLYFTYKTQNNKQRKNFHYFPLSFVGKKVKVTERKLCSKKKNKEKRKWIFHWFFLLKKLFRYKIHMSWHDSLNF